VGPIDTAGEKVDAGVLRALGRIETVPAREDQVGPLEELRFSLVQLGRRILEGGQLIHAVIDGDERHQMAGKGYGHGRGVPEDGVMDLLVGEQPVDELSLERVDVDLWPGGEVGDHSLKSMLPDLQLEVG
jgi:hypothetical protein